QRAYPAPNPRRKSHQEVRSQPYGYQIVSKSSARCDKLEKLFKFAHPGFRVFLGRKPSEIRPGGGLTRIRS
ncbi:hypothetical protein ON021_07815, partial [Microcoleus sp. HI-ES]|nr:hypothetical protein [Microcoleus sp. HI-ES]